APYIVFVESDDYIEPDMVETLYRNVMDSGADIVKGGFNTFIGDQDDRFFFPKTPVERFYDFNRIVTPIEEQSAFRWTMYEWMGIYKKSFLEEQQICHNETKGAAFQDIGFWFLGFAHARKVMIIPKALYHYRCDNPSASVKNPQKVFCTNNEYEYIRAKLSEELWLRLAGTYYSEWFHSNMEAYGHLAEDLRPMLSSKMHEILKEAHKEKQLDRDAFRYWERDLMRLLLSSSAGFDEDRRARVQQIHANHKKMICECKNAGKIVVCCAGSHGANIQYLLKSAGIEITAYADNDEGRWGDRMNGVPIMSPDDAARAYSDALFLIANRDHGEEIRNELLCRTGLRSEQIRVCEVDRLPEAYI
ncbi:MAG: hypothetical protein IK096_03330, partial [Lachnospiraceae bacterium]|nr:hypothetical protein [Lachnospiraceae bacterium]